MKKTGVCNKNRLDDNKVAPVFVLSELSSFLTIKGDREYREDKDSGRKFLLSTGLINELNLAGLNPKMIVVADATVFSLHKEGKPIMHMGELLGYKKRIKLDSKNKELNIWNIDHHFSVVAMQRYVSSTNLAIELMNNRLIDVNDDLLVVVNHADTDSVLSSLVLRGFFDLEKKIAGRKWKDVLGEAAIAADHTGQPNVIADLLQSIQDMKIGEGQPKKYARAVKNLKILFDCLNKLDKYPRTEREIGGVLLNENVFSRRVVQKVKNRLDSRVFLKKEFELNKFQQFKNSGIWYWSSDRDIEGELVVGAMKDCAPKAKIVLIDFPFHGKKAMRVRSLNEKINLHELGVTLLDFNYGGRWNAGSNRRAGGMNLQIKEIARRLSILIGKRKESILHAQNLVVEFRNKIIDCKRDYSKIEIALRLMVDLHLDHEDRIEKDFNKLYLTHPIEVAKILIDEFGVVDEDMIIAALMHDVLEDESEKLAKIYQERMGERLLVDEAAIKELRHIFGFKVSVLIKGLTNPKVTNSKEKKMVYQDHIKNILENDHLLKIKLADFIHNAFNLDKLKSDNKRKKLISKYLPVAKIWLDFMKTQSEKFEFLDSKKKKELMIKLQKFII